MRGLRSGLRVSLSSAAIIAVTVGYGFVAATKLSHAEYGFALMWASYATANIGLLMAGGAQ